MLIYDIEIANPIPPSDGGKLIEGIKYAKGFEFPATMGLACIGVYDYTTDKWRVFGEYELESFQALVNQSDVCVGFNNIRFDNVVLATCNVEIPVKKSYDILAQIYNTLKSRPKGCRLENVVKANFPNAQLKNENSADVPIFWQQGYHTRVIDYCLNDVRMTKQLVDKILRFGYINNPIDPSKILKMERP
jgi:hypothetical protein